ncbi:MAG: DUF2804 domain-containing protein [Candidatus Lernaella stagnicola]|nr:DUF2804 domain-containing protein [Candidatus Lernaella stagnicola]
MRSINATPPWLVKDGRVVDFGLFRSPFKNLNIHEAKLFPRWQSAPRWVTNLRLKEWQHVAVVHKDFALGFAVVDSHYLGTSFCYFVDRSTGTHVEHNRQTSSRKVRVAGELWNDTCLFEQPGYRIEILNRLDTGRHLVNIAVSAQGDLPEITAEFEMLADLTATEPLIVVLPIDGKNRPLYTHKAPCPVRGTMNLGGTLVEMTPENDFAMLDVQKTFYPYRTFWNWATCVGRNAEGRSLALNLVENIITDDERYNENCLWVDGKLTPWSAVRFQFNDKDLMAPWHIETTDGRCRLDFHPQGERQEKINFGIVLSDFHQPYGLFSGTVVDAQGTEHEIKDFYGVCERHLARF